MELIFFNGLWFLAMAYLLLRFLLWLIWQVERCIFFQGVRSFSTRSKK